MATSVSRGKSKQTKNQYTAKSSQWPTGSGRLEAKLTEF